MKDIILGKYSELALKVATEAHKGQTRWDKKTPYITHPVEVARNAIKREKELGLTFTADQLDILVAISIVHDCVEDTEITAQNLVDFGFPDEVIVAVEALTHDKSKEYVDYINDIKNRDNIYALIVKLSDLEHNLSDLSKGSMRDKYLMAKYILEN